MKKKAAVFLLLSAVVLAMLAGCSGKTQEPVQEPDTESQTQTRPLGKHQKVVYSFHIKRAEGSSRGHIYMTLISEDVENPENWCGIEIGNTDSLDAFRAHHTSGLPSSERWKSPLKNRGKWEMEEPYGSMADVEEADVTVTYSRSGKQLRATLEIDGEKAWSASVRIGGLSEKTTCLYLSADQYILTDIVYQDMGYFWELPEILQGLLFIVAILAGIAAICVIHNFAKKGEMKLYYLDEPLLGVLISTGFFVSTAALVLLIVGRSHPDALSKLFFGYLPIPLAAGGAGFWVPAAISAVLMLVLGGVVLTQGFEVDNPVLRVLAALGLGFCHALWYFTLVNIVLQSLDTIMALIMIGLFVAGMGVVVNNSVVKTYHVYGKNGYVGPITTLEAKEEEKTDKK